MTIPTLLRPLGGARAGRATNGQTLVGRISFYRRIIARWITRRRTRIALCDIAHDDHLLKDIGVSRQEALREADKPFWQP